MANYPLTQSGAEVQALLNKVQTPDSAPTTGSTNLVTSGGTKAALDQKVDEVSGKGLSTNDYTDAEKQKLNGIASGAQVNVIEGVQVNGTDLPVSGKKVNVTVPTKTSDINNDSGFITKGVNNLTNYKDNDALNELLERSVYETPTEANFGLMPTLGGQPGILFCEGAPTAANKPLNWVDFMDGGYEWTGLPSVIGQHVRDITNGTDYWGYRNPSTELMEWK